jgi:hypothetical protein
MLAERIALFRRRVSGTRRHNLLRACRCHGVAPHCLGWIVVRIKVLKHVNAGPLIAIDRDL